MAEEKNIIDILDRVIDLTKLQAEVSKKHVELVNQEKEISDELFAIKDVLKLHIKTQKEMQSALFDKMYSYNKKDGSYKKD
jgi:hypothetical protein